MNATLGYAGVLLGFLAAVVGAATLVAGVVKGRVAWVRQGGMYAGLLLGAAVLATFAMEKALLSNDFSIDFVANNHSRHTPLLFTIAGMWSALQGSILLWGLILAIYIAGMVHHFRARRDDAMVAWATAISLVVAAFFFGLMLGPANPFKGIAGGIVPPDGAGPNPLLQDNPLMAFHPPVLYAGYVGFTIPFSFGLAALITGRLGEGWLVETRRWTMVAWGFLSVGIVLGSWWSYQVLGWGGFWAWDPVENASLLPWLTGTAFLHSVMVQERRAMLRVWNLSLLSSTFALTILGTFFTRSGVLQSVHEFSNSPLGPALITAFGVVVVVTCGLVFWRADRLGSPGAIASPVSREAFFLANNVVFAAFAFVVLLGTVFPLIVSAVNGDQLSVGRPFFDATTRPLGMTLLFLMAVAPVLPWRGVSTAVARERLWWPAVFAASVLVSCVVFGLRGGWTLATFGLAAFVTGTAVRQIGLSVKRLGWRGFTGRSSGGMVAHLGIALIAVGFAASQSFGSRAELQMRAGDSARVDGHTVTFMGLRNVSYASHSSSVADVRLDGGGLYHPALSTYSNVTDAVGTPAVRSNAWSDVYFTLVRTPDTSGDPSVLSVVVQPLVSWLWAGGMVIALGTVLALVSVRRPTFPAEVPSETVAAQAETKEAALV